MSDGKLLKVIKSYEDLIDLVKDRIAEFNVALTTIDSLAGLPDRYCEKLVNCRRRFGPVSFSTVLPALGIRLVAVEDTEQLEAIKSRLVPCRYKYKRSFQPQHD